MRRYFNTHGQTKAWLVFAAVLALAASVTSAYAQQWLNASGMIRTTTLSYGNNFAFRGHIEQGGVQQLSTRNNYFAYIGTDDSNYQAKVAALLTAASQGKSVELSFTKDGAGWCTITDFSVNF